MKKYLNWFLFIIGFPLWLVIITLAWIVGRILGHTNSWIAVYKFFKEITLEA